jgi:hypothetical protein
MESDDRLAQWAALFLNTCAEGTPGTGTAAPHAPNVGVVHYKGVTEAAGELLRAVDAGGVPAFVTGNLKQIAIENGIDAGAQRTPNEIVDAIRQKSRDSESGEPEPGD